MKYLYLGIGIFMIAFMGYGAYALYPRFDLNQKDLSLPLLAIVAGSASFFSPCSFPLLATLLARESGIKEYGASSSSIQRAGLFAGALAIGASLFFVVMGIGLAFGASTLFASVTFTSSIGRFIRLGTGILLIVLGLMQLEKLPNRLMFVADFASPLMRYQARYRQQSPTLGFFILGFAYPIGGFG